MLQAAINQVVTNRARAAVERLIEKSPGFAGLILWIRYQDSPSDTSPSGIKTYGWTDGKSVWFTPTFSELTPRQQVAVAAHEFMHVALRHIPRMRELISRMENFKPLVWNIACDSIINEYLQGQSYLELPGEPPILSKLFETYKQQLTKAGKPVPPLPAPLSCSSEDIYHFLLRWEQEMPDQSPISGLADDLGGFRDLEPGQGADRAEREKESEEGRKWKMRLERAKAGDRPGGILRRIDGDLPDIDTPWERILRTKLMRMLTFAPEKDPCRPARRWLGVSVGFGHLNVPYESGFRFTKERPRLAVLVDTSGSIGNEMLNRFMAEITAIARITRAEMHVIVCDAAVTGVFKVREGQRPDMAGIEFRGGGGTDFEPALNVAADLDVDAAVYLTDLQGPTGPKRAFPVIWAVPARSTDQVPEPPFGQVVCLK